MAEVKAASNLRDKLDNKRERRQKSAITQTSRMDKESKKAIYSTFSAWSSPANSFLVEAADLDPRAFAEPVDIVPKLSPSLQTALKSSKWKERKEALDDLSTLLSSTPRIKDAPEIGELAKSLASRISGDANISCVMVAAACIEDLAKGMMAGFAKYREIVVPLMLERMKERKATVTDSIGSALDAVFTTVSACLLHDIFVIISSCLFRANFRTQSLILNLQ
jgi:hypothetical protein